VPVPPAGTATAPPMCLTALIRASAIAVRVVAIPAPYACRDLHTIALVAPTMCTKVQRNDVWAAQLLPTVELVETHMPVRVAGRRLRPMALVL